LRRRFEMGLFSVFNEKNNKIGIERVHARRRARKLAMRNGVLELVCWLTKNTSNMMATF